MKYVSSCWYGIFLDAYTYSSTYLLFTITITIASILILWIYEKPRFYKLIFKRSKHSNIILTPVPSDEVILPDQDESVPEGDYKDFLKTANTFLETEKKADLIL